MKSTIKLLTVIAIISFFASCSVSKTAVVKQSPREKYEAKLRECSKRYVRNMDSLSIRFQRLTLEMVSSDEPFDTLFAAQMLVVGDSIRKIMTDVYMYQDSLEAYTAEVSNANWRPFTLYVEDATQERTIELLTKQLGLRQTFNEVVTESVYLGKLNFHILRGEPLSTDKMTLLEKGMLKYNSPKKDSKLPAYKDIENQYLVSIGANPGEKYYSASVSKEFRVTYATTVQKANLWLRMLESRKLNNR